MTESAGKERELRRMMEQYGSDLLRLSFVYLRDQHLAEDAVQDTFLKAYRALDAYRREGSEKAWLTRIAVNTCRDILRSAWLRRVDRRISPESVPEASTDAALPDHTVTRAVMALPVKYKEVVLLRFYEGMKLHEIAGVLHVSVETVKSRLRGAKDRLREGLKGWYFDEE